MAATPPLSADPAGAGELPLAQERLAIAALALAAFALNLNTNVLGALLPFVRQAMPLGDGGANWLLAAAGGGSALGALLVQPLARRFGRRATLVGGLLAFVACSALHLAAASLWPFLVLRAASGAAVGVAYAQASALVAEVSPYGRRGAAMGWFNAGLFLAIPAGMPLAVALANAGSWQAIFAVQAAVGALGCWWSARAVPLRPLPAANRGTLDLLRRVPVLAGLLATALHVGSFFTTVQLAAVWLDETGRVPKDRQVWLWVGLGLASVLGSALLGRVSDRVGKRNFVLATSVLLVVWFVLLARDPGPLALLGLGAALAATAAARTGPLQALLSGLVPMHELGALMGLRGFVMQAGVAGFALAATSSARSIGFQGVLLLAAGCQIASYLAIRVGVREAR